MWLRSFIDFKSVKNKGFFVRFAIVFFKYFPYGGLQRDALEIAHTLVERNHEVEIFTMSWQGEMPERIKIHIVSTSGWLNYRRYAQFSAEVMSHIHQQSFDAVIGFNKMPGLTVYYAADPCFADTAHEKFRFWYRYIPRYRYFYKAEEAVFSKKSKTEIFLIAPLEQAKFMAHYQTPANRFHYLPPGVRRDRMRPDNAKKIRAQMRAELKLADDELLVLMIGSGFKTKGLDRALYAMNALPKLVKSKTKFIVIGQDNPSYFLRLTEKLGLEGRVTIYSGRDDIPKFLLAADVLIHPAYRENAGVVLLEALCAGLPVLTTQVCGYAHYIEKAKAGVVLKLPFSQIALNQQLKNMLTDTIGRARYSRAGVHFSLTHDLYSLASKAASLIEKIAREKHENSE